MKTMAKQEIVVLVHGLYTHGRWLSLLARRLQRTGYATVAFSYPSVRRAPADNAGALQDLVASLDAPVVHFLAHSLGGLVVRHLFSRFPDQPPGRVVTLGTPHQGSYTARVICGRGLQFALGCSIDQGLLQDIPPWPPGRELGSLAGTLNIGLGRLLAGIPRPSDGTVAVAETYLPGMTDHICLPVSHMGMLLAPSVAVQACAFFAMGRFNHRMQLGSAH